MRGLRVPEVSRVFVHGWGWVMSLTDEQLDALVAKHLDVSQSSEERRTSPILEGLDNVAALDLAALTADVAIAVLRMNVVTPAPEDGA